jgi:hypothetical protein
MTIQRGAVDLMDSAVALPTVPQRQNNQNAVSRRIAPQKIETMSSDLTHYAATERILVGALKGLRGCCMQTSIAASTKERQESARSCPAT